MSARRMVLAGGLLLLLRAVTALAGLDGWASVISGTPPAGVSLETAAVGAVALVVLQLATVLIAPVLLIAAALLTLADRHAATSLDAGEHRGHS
ncbi:MAG: hypothetical protein U0325_17635 [Polyangiales bacterium]